MNGKRRSGGIRNGERDHHQCGKAQRHARLANDPIAAMIGSATIQEPRSIGSRNSTIEGDATTSTITTSAPRKAEKHRIVAARPRARPKSFRATASVTWLGMEKVKPSWQKVARPAIINCDRKYCPMPR